VFPFEIPPSLYPLVVRQRFVPFVEGGGFPFGVQPDHVPNLAI
jgi:hypothetical protein